MNLDVADFYRRFNTPVTDFDCAEKCTPYHPAHLPFCCDICHAVPVAYQAEWQYLQQHTDQWRLWHGNDCPAEPLDDAELRSQTPDHLLLLTCKGAVACQRQYRASSCRQFPFFPYITSGGQFIGLAYEWAFESVCWVISHLAVVTAAYRNEFVAVYDDLLARFEADFESYYYCSEDMRDHFAAQKRRIPILHRNGEFYLLSPLSERLQKADPQQFRRFGFYQK